MRLSQLSTLMPGDFATVVRQARALGTRYDAEQLFGVLEAECRAKTSGGAGQGIHRVDIYSTEVRHVPCSKS